MCTMIAEKVEVAGSGKSAKGWFALDRAYVAFDHPFHVQLEHALCLDFVNEAAGADHRVAVELDPASARRLAEGILAALAQADE